MPPQDVAETEKPGKPELPKWQRPEKTKHDLPWADIQIIDLSTFDEPGGKEKLAAELRDAIHHTGFFSVVGTGISRREGQRQYDIAQAFFALPHAEKAKPEYKCDFAQGNYFGYREIYEATVRGTAVCNNVELWNHAKFTERYAGEARHPFFEDLKGEIEAFSRHRYDSPSDDHLRSMSYRPRTATDDAAVENTWARAHTDFGTLTLLWSQNVAGLQIKTSSSGSGPDEGGEWRYVPPVDTDKEGEGEGTGVICNVGDALDFWSARRRTASCARRRISSARIALGLFYFVRPGDEAVIEPAAASPLLRRLGLVKSSQEKEKEEKEKVTGSMYVRARVKDYHSHGDYADRTGQVFQVGNLKIVDEAR
ncbi:uncharacterized protein PG986_010374 [Apiospora aurea]|uniref:Uncharacterized protein n=1 Tax=Apiospora aurea TaxID=335848 RepID=A0ABR1Q218_9PEZI